MVPFFHFFPRNVKKLLHTKWGKDGAELSSKVYLFPEVSEVQSTSGGGKTESDGRNRWISRILIWQWMLQGRRSPSISELQLFSVTALLKNSSLAEGEGNTIGRTTVSTSWIPQSSQGMRYQPKSIRGLVSGSHYICGSRLPSGLRGRESAWSSVDFRPQRSEMLEGWDGSRWVDEEHIFRGEGEGREGGELMEVRLGRGTTCEI